MNAHPIPWFTLFLVTLCLGCQVAVRSETPVETTEESEIIVERLGSEQETEIVESAELAPYMGELHRFSQKLGYAIQGENQPLAAFYADELEEVLSELETIDEHEGMPISKPVNIIMNPLLLQLEAAITAADWKSSWLQYEALVDGCNRCHAATEHEYIEILTTENVPSVFNQKF